MKDHTGMLCVPYPMLGKTRVGRVITDGVRTGGSFVNVKYLDNGEIDQVSAHLTAYYGEQKELAL